MVLGLISTVVGMSTNNDASDIPNCHGTGSTLFPLQLFIEIFRKL